MALRTVGCRLNQCETAQMQDALRTAGYRLVGWDEPADVRVLNTCTVTNKSDRTCRHNIHSAKRRDPHCLLAVTGCLAQVAPDFVAALPGVDLVLGNPDKQHLAEHLSQALRARRKGPTVAVSPYPTRPDFDTEFFAHFHGRTRAFLKIQTGCDSRCAYCIVPLARGPARSMPKDKVLEQARLLAKHGYREIVLTGIDLGSWGRDSGEGSTADLLQALVQGEGSTNHTARPDRAARTGKAVRFRLSSLEPLEVDDALLDVVQDSGDRVARHFHLPLQSGADSVLGRMGRPYSSARYLEVANKITRRLPEAALGADVIVGFPGETDDEFDQTLALVEASPLAYLHVFAYSDRPGTAAVAMEPKIPPDIIRERSRRLRNLGALKKAAFHDGLTSTEQRALILEKRSSNGRLVGLTGNYVEVLVTSEQDLLNCFVRVRLDKALPDGSWDTTLLERED